MIRVYKVKLKENILRQVIFTDRNLCIACLILTTLFVFIVGASLPDSLRILISMILNSILLLLFTLQIDEQNIFKIITLAFKFYINKKGHGRNSIL